VTTAKERQRTYNEGGSLALLASAQLVNGVENLNTCASVDIEVCLCDRATEAVVVSRTGCGHGGQTPDRGYLHIAKCGVDSSTPQLDSNLDIEGLDLSFEWLEILVLVWEYSKDASFYTDADTTEQHSRVSLGADRARANCLRADVVLGRLEPGVALGLLKNVMQNGIVGVVIHAEPLALDWAGWPTDEKTRVRK